MTRRVTEVGTRAYIDGFNLYHGAKELVDSSPTPTTQWKWLDLRQLAQRLAPSESIEHVRYFTAHVKPVSTDTQLPQRQATYLRALATQPDVTVHLGLFQRGRKRMPLVAPPTDPAVRAQIRDLGVSIKDEPDGNFTVKVWKTEEKGSDVNLATYLVRDAFLDLFTNALVISNDTDLCEPIRLVIEERGKTVTVVNPRGHLRPAAELQRVATATRPLRVAALQRSQLPLELTDDVGVITRPSSW